MGRVSFLLSLIAALVAIMMLGGAVFWLVRGMEVFAYQQLEYAPNPYLEGDLGREQLFSSSNAWREVEWHLADGTRQVAYYHPPENGSVILFAHGSPGRGAGLVASEGLGLLAAGYGLLSLDLPGYGASEGERLWDGAFVESIRKGVDFALAQRGVDANRIAGLGYSNGGCAMASAAAEDDRLGALILLASFTNLSDQLHYAFKRRTPALGYFAIAAARFTGVPVDALDTARALRARGDRPTLIIAGGKDRQVSLSMARDLKSVVSGAEKWIYDDLGHTGFARVLGEDYLDRVDRWLQNAFYSEARAPEQI